MLLLVNFFSSRLLAGHLLGFQLISEIWSHKIEIVILRKTKIRSTLEKCLKTFAIALNSQEKSEKLEFSMTMEKFHPSVWMTTHFFRLNFYQQFK